MQILSLDGKLLYEGNFITRRRAVEAAVRDGVDLSRANLRRAALAHAVLDGARLAGACLWGAALTGAQMATVDLTGADMRMAQMKEVCLAESACADADFRGAYLSGAIVRDADFSSACFSCPSVFSVAWEDAACLDDAVYWHRGETPCALSRLPLVVSGLPRRIVVMDAHVLVGTDLYPLGHTPVAKRNAWMAKR